MQKRNIDQFADIGFQEQLQEKNDCVEVEPNKFVETYFKQSHVKAEKINEHTLTELRMMFDQQLREMREKFTPFLQNFVQEKEIQRKVIELKQFQFRYHEKEDCDITRVFSGEGEWEDVTIPDFRGPSKEEGKWTGYYRTEFSYDKTDNYTRHYISFTGVDYEANVYVNDRYIGSHEGFFAPFEFDITDYLLAENILIVEVKNDYPTLGVNGGKLDGDKLYAATGLGWDDPELGWHHCPPGGGIYNKVCIEERSPIFIKDVFVRPMIEKDEVEVWVDVVSTDDQIVENFEIEIDILPKNFTNDFRKTMRFQVEYAGPGMNYYRYPISLTDYQLWELDHPYLYNARTTIIYENEKVDMVDQHFGMRSFYQDETEMVKGSFYFNERPIILRGANEMGHLQWCVMKDDYEQLIDDILIAKLANMNFYRITQRPVQKEIYDYFDMLGMMHQTDLPLFSFLRRNQFSEAVRQSAEMERLIRSHPSTVIVSLMNEAALPDKLNKRRKGHRHLHRDELEAFFVAARKAMYIENPDRVVKNIDGDFEPPTDLGMPDFHSYNMWYTNHAIPISKMYKGFIPPIKKNWKAGCGEYGAEALDNYETMIKHYPKEWLPEDDNNPWFPDQIVSAQTHSMHGDWYPEQTNIHQWIEESQRHQALATKLMTDSLRLRSDRVVSTAIHLLIDAWPSGWMKALVDVERIPKLGYFAYQKSLEPVRVYLRSDRKRAYSNEEVKLEAWLLNDTAIDMEGCQIYVTVRDDKTDYQSFYNESTAVKVSPTYAATIVCPLPTVESRKQVYFDAMLLDKGGNTINEERFSIEVFPQQKESSEKKVAVIGEQARQLCQKLKITPEDYGKKKYDTVVVSNAEIFQSLKNELEKQCILGTKLVFIRDDKNEFEYEVNNESFIGKKMQDVFFLAINHDQHITGDFHTQDLSFLYNEIIEQFDFTTSQFIDNENLIPLAYSYRQPAFNTQTTGMKGKKVAIGYKSIENGQAFFVCSEINGRIGVNPTYDLLLKRIIKE